MKLYYNIIMIILFMVMGFASAEVQSLPTQKLNDCVLLEQTCASCSYVNFESIKYPNSSMEYFNAAMDINGNKYTYNFCNLTELGRYIVTTCGDVDGTETCVDYDFETTVSGNVQTTSQGINSAAFLLLMISLASIFGFVGFKLSNHKTFWVLGVLFMFLGLILLVYDVWLGFEYSRFYIGNDNNGGTPQIIFFIFLMCLTAGLFMGIVMILKNWRDIYNNVTQAVTGKDPDDDGYDGDIKNAGFQ
jgi:hypothetical protein